MPAPRSALFDIDEKRLKHHKQHDALGLDGRLKSQPEPLKVEGFVPCNDEEKELLERVNNGEVSRDEMKRIIATRAFENAIRNPHRLTFNHFIKLQQLQMREGKIKQRKFGQWGL